MNKNDKRNDNVANKKILIIFISVFVAAVLVFGLILGIIVAVKNSRAAVKYDGYTMSEEETAYFLSYYKYRYMMLLSQSGVENVEDTKGFWNKIDENENKTYGELLKSGAEQFLKEIIVSVSIFNRYDKLNSSEKTLIKSAAKNVLTYRADGNRDKFNELAAEYGFSYNSFKSATEIFYKAAMAQNAVYGSDGSRLSSFPELCAEYLAEYSHVKLLFIRTEDKFLLDDGGNRVIGDDGKDKTVPLTEEEKLERQSLIHEINGYIAAIGNGDVEMGAAMFDYYLQNHDEGDSDMHNDGYYFHNSSDFTKEFSSQFSAVVEKAYSMASDSYASVELDFGVCFIYKYAPTQGAYMSDAAKICFEDFYQNAALRLFEKNLDELSTEVILTDNYKKLDIVKIPYNHTLIPSFN